MLRFTMQTRRSAMAFTRRTHNVPDGVLIGWVPYRVLVTDNAISHRAFDGSREFTRWLRSTGKRAVLHARSPGLAVGIITEAV